MPKSVAVGRIFNVKKYAGQGLIEIVITVLIIAGTVLALIRFQIALTYSNSVSQQQNIALILANKQIETLRDFSVLTGANSYANVASGSSTTTITHAVYTITWTVTASTNPTYKNIHVSVTWIDRNGVSQSISLVSHVAGIDPATSSIIMG